MPVLICALCGDEVEQNIDGCHVKSKPEFTKDQIDDKEDRHMNIINLCKKHHNLFDKKKKLGIKDFDPNKQPHFVRWDHCTKGICIQLPVEQELLRNLDLIAWGGSGNKIDPDYIVWKNSELSCPKVKEFCLVDGTPFNYELCRDPRID